MSDVPAKDRLHYISPVEAIHAIHSDVSHLLGMYSACLIGNTMLLVEPMAECDHKVVKPVKLVFHLLDKL